MAWQPCLWVWGFIGLRGRENDKFNFIVFNYSTLLDQGWRALTECINCVYFLKLQFSKFLFLSSCGVWSVQFNSSILNFAQPLQELSSSTSCTMGPHACNAIAKHLWLSLCTCIVHLSSMSIQIKMHLYKDQKHDSPGILHDAA